MGLKVSVVLPFYNSAETLPACLMALGGQNLPREDYEVIAVDDGSEDGGGELVTRHGARLLRQQNRGAPAARNAGIAAATAPWVALIDADCIPSRGWLRALCGAVAGAGRPALGAAGRVVGHASTTPAARFVDLTGGLDTERHLSHPRFPFAPSGNLLYRREALERVGGFDERFDSYDACDLHTRLRDRGAGPFLYEPRAVVLHRHRPSWQGYWRQQRGYGRGLGQFYLRHRDRVDWSATREVSAWLGLAPIAAAALSGGDGDEVLVRRGNLVKALAQRVGFVERYFSRTERGRW